jgi:alkanesulfonate monooxygenase SsuD/methylene tetrahydromethanopterin reductase-like flavin-dependent oxidoreductase (luciferase family)
MRYGFVLPAGDAADAAELAVEAEAAGWDGFFVWEPVWGVDAWVALTAAAMKTERIRLGTMLTPLPRRKPWDLAGQTAALDNLSGGRVILSVGLGALHEGWLAFERDVPRRTRAELLDEGLAVLTGLWSGQPFEFSGTHFDVRPTDFHVPAAPVQRPRIPIWVVGLWPAPPSMRRAARWDGWLPNFRGQPVDGSAATGESTPAALAEAVAWIRAERQRHGLDMVGFDVIVEGVTRPEADAAGTVRPWIEAGATWWLEANWMVAREEAVRASRERLRAGPPRA